MCALVQGASGRRLRALVCYWLCPSRLWGKSIEYSLKVLQRNRISIYKNFSLSLFIIYHLSLDTGEEIYYRN